MVVDDLHRRHIPNGAVGPFLVVFLRGFWNHWDQPGTLDVLPNIDQFLRVTDLAGSPNASLGWDSYNLEGQHTLDFGPSNRLTYGVNYRHNAFSSNILAEFTREDRLGLYVQDQWRATSWLTAVAGLRFDMDTFINPTYSPRGSLIFNPAEDHTFRIGIAVAYRPPTVFENSSLNLGVVCFPGPPFLPPCTLPGAPPGLRTATNTLRAVMETCLPSRSSPTTPGTRAGTGSTAQGCE